MPPGQDPDEVIRRSPRDWSKLVESAVPAITFRINAITTQADTSTPDGKAKCVSEAAPFIHLLGAGIQQSNAVELLATNLEVPLDTVKAALSRPSMVKRTRRAEQHRPASTTSSPFTKLDRDPVEEHCLQLLLAFPELRQLASGLRADFFQRHENKEIFTRWLSIGTQIDKEETVKQIIRNGDDEVSRHLTLLSERPMVQSDVGRRGADMLETVSRLEERTLKTLKVEEAKRFAETPPDLNDRENDDVLQINQQIKHNEGLRRGQE